jgi:hypothetical protein
MSQAPTEPLPRLVDCLRLRKLRYARLILVIAGLFLMGFSLVVFAMAEEVVRREFARANIPVKPQELQRWVRIEQVFQLGQAGVGLALAVCGLAIYRAPLFCSIAATVIFVLHQAICLAVEPLSLFRGAIMKILIVIALVGAIQAAIRYRRPKNLVAPDSETYEGQLVND